MLKLISSSPIQSKSLLAHISHVFLQDCQIEPDFRHYQDLMRPHKTSKAIPCLNKAKGYLREKLAKTAWTIITVPIQMTESLNVEIDQLQSKSNPSHLSQVFLQDSQIEPDFQHYQDLTRLTVDKVKP